MRTLVLGGGAAKGYAHIGVIKYLEECGFTPELIVGSSMGALVGGFYASGFTVQEMIAMANKIDLKMKHRLFPMQLSSQGLVQGKEVVDFLYGYLGKQQIQKLPIKYAGVAMDLDRQCEIVIDKGDLVQAIRSSISIPVVFFPHQYYGHTFSDSGFINPIPVTAARSIGATRIIAVNVLKQISFPSTRLKKKKAPSKKHSAWDVLFKTIEHAVSRLVDYQATHLENGVIININTGGVKLSDFEKATEAIVMGYKQAKKYHKEIKEFLRS
jgi:NTE family protein